MSTKTKLKYFAWLVGIIAIAGFFFWAYTDGLRTTETYVRPTPASAPVVTSKPAEEDSRLLKMTVQELKDEYAERIRNGKDGKSGEIAGYQVGAGEMFASYDPTKELRLSGACLVPHGKRPVDCDSYGPYQEKIGTIVDNYPKVYGKEVTEVEALNVALDPEKAKAFLIDCSVKIPLCAWRWTSAQSQPEYVNVVVALIRKLDKTQ